MNLFVLGDILKHFRKISVINFIFFTYLLTVKRLGEQGWEEEGGGVNLTTPVVFPELYFLQILLNFLKSFGRYEDFLRQY